MSLTAEGRIFAAPMSEPGRLRLAVPNKGRMQQPSLQLLHDAGLEFEDGTRALTARVEGFPLDILFVRTDDIVEFVADGVADLGITGTNLLIESGADLEVLIELGYGYCRLEAAVPNDSPAQRLEDLGDMRLATSHPHSAATSFAKLGLEPEIVTISGAVEVAPKLGLADGVVDLVSSGSTMIMNGLRSVGSLFASQAILVASRKREGATAAVADELRTMLEAVIAGRGVKYLMMNAPVDALPAIESILPGLESPSVLPLAHDGMVAVHAVVAAGDVHRILVPLREAGATGILVVPVEKLLP
ncbi:MAG: ATP phosphoribosyltransferase [Chloroflexota bacterium]